MFGLQNMKGYEIFRRLVEDFRGTSDPADFEPSAISTAAAAEAAEGLNITNDIATLFCCWNNSKKVAT